MTTVLLCDDDRVMLQILEVAVKHADKDALIFSTNEPKIAIDAAKRIGFNFAFVDWYMPGYTGADVLRELPDPCIRILCTAREVNDDLRANAVEAGAHGIFSKPVNMNQVSDIIKGKPDRLLVDVIASGHS